MSKERISISLLVLTALLSALTLGTVLLRGNLPPQTGNALAEPTCNVLGINLHGSLVTYSLPVDENSVPADETASEDIVGAIKEAEKDPAIKAILLEVDSLGGSPVAGEEVADALRSATKPTAALIRGYGDSAAYLAATGAEKVFASVFSDVGSIGITMSYEDYAEYNRKEGITYNSLTSGKFKDAFSPSKALTEEEKGLVLRDLEIMHQAFVEKVAENRGLPEAKIAALADGSTMLGAMALENGLIDQIGGQTEVDVYLEEQIGENVEYCWQ
jgi:protease-4